MGSYKRGREGPALEVPAWVASQLGPGEKAAFDLYDRWYAVPEGETDVDKLIEHSRLLEPPAKPRSAKSSKLPRA